MKCSRILSALLLCLPLADFEVRAAEPPVLAALERGSIYSYSPAHGQISFNLDYTRRAVRLPEAARIGAETKEVVVELRDSGNKVLFEGKIPLQNAISGVKKFSVPELEGEYDLVFRLMGGAEPVELTRKLVRQRFPWEGNKLGLSDTVPAPFTPVEVEGNRVSVVGRTMTLGGLGLWDQVESEGRKLLAGPMTIKVESPGGKVASVEADLPSIQKISDRQASVRGKAISDLVSIDTTSTIDFDGCMRVDLQIGPGKQPAPIDRLWLEIPVKESEAPFFTSLTDANRSNLPRRTPSGEGVIWSSKEDKRNPLWQSPFNTYLMLGGAERGVAWFAENDRGWFTGKGKEAPAVQELVRENGQLLLRIYLINVPTTLAATSQITFGIQAAPTKPMPENWRKNASEIPGSSGPVNPWGGTNCAARVPYRGDWSIVEKILEAHRTGKVDREWFVNYASANNPPNVHGKVPWLQRTLYFTEPQFSKRPILVYAEEMRGLHISPEWHTFQDDWSTANFSNRLWPDESVLRKGFDVNPSSDVIFPQSYQDYSLWVHDQWLQRGIGLYWDNTYPKLSLNTRMTAAYQLPDGQIQPCIALWNQRQYMMRTYDLFSDHRKRFPEKKLEWSNHMTTTLLLPLHTWGTTTLDLEYSIDHAVDPVLILAEATGRHVGCYPHALFPLSGKNSKPMAELRKINKSEADFRDNAMRFVHELIGGMSRESGPYYFGYGEPHVEVMPYWAEEPALTSSDKDVRWILLHDTQNNDFYLVLSNWSVEPKKVELSFSDKVFKLLNGNNLYDARTGAQVALNGKKISLQLEGVHGAIHLTTKAPASKGEN